MDTAYLTAFPRAAAILTELTDCIADICERALVIQARRSVPLCLYVYNRQVPPCQSFSFSKEVRRAVFLCQQIVGDGNVVPPV